MSRGQKQRVWNIGLDHKHRGLWIGLESGSVWIASLDHDRLWVLGVGPDLEF